MSARGKARKRALDVLFESEARAVDPLATLAQRVTDADPPVNDYTAALVKGVTDHRERIDDLLTEHSHNWSLARMPAVDRTVLRIGTYELLWRDDVPDAVAIAEAVALARDLSTDESPAFVNGVLAAMLEHRADLEHKTELEHKTDPREPEPAVVAAPPGDLDA